MPKTGERRKTHRPFAIDKLPPEWRERIIVLRAKWTPWERIEEESAQWEWDKLSPSQRQLYPKRRIPMRTLHRWYDVQVNQKLREIESERASSLEIAARLGAHGFEKLDESVKNAIADVVFSSPKGSGDPEHFRKKLLDLGWLLARNRQLDIAKEKVKVERLKVEDVIARGNRATLEAAQKLSKGRGVTLDDINRIRERTFGLPPIERKEADPALLQRKLDVIYGIEHPAKGEAAAKAVLT
jgi:hypothetical protein